MPAASEFWNDLRAPQIYCSILAIIMIPLLLLPLAVDIDSRTENVLSAVDWIIWGIFAADLAIRTYFAEQRLTYLRRHWYDVLIVLLPFLRPLRVVQSARLLLLLRLGRLLPFVIRIGAVMKRVLRRRGMQYLFLFGLGAVTGCAGLVLLAERGQGGAIQNYEVAIWWAMTTITTVGYGDAVPVTVVGRGLAVFLMIVGISIFSWITANIAAFMVEYGGADDRSITLEDLMNKLETLEEQIQSLSSFRTLCRIRHSEVVQCFRRSPMWLASQWPHPQTWVK